MNDTQYIQPTKKWVDNLVVGLNLRLCKNVMNAGKSRQKFSKKRSLGSLNENIVRNNISRLKGARRESIKDDTSNIFERNFNAELPNGIVLTQPDICPFAKRELVKDRVRFIVTHVETEPELLVCLDNCSCIILIHHIHVVTQSELELLDQNNAIETTLLILPDMLLDFFEYNQFLVYADDLLIQLEMDGVYQIASFHPDYQFGGTAPDAAENFTNRSPYPTLHLIREASLEKAIANYPDVDKIPENNISLMNRMGCEKMQALLSNSFSEQDT